MMEPPRAAGPSTVPPIEQGEALPSYARRLAVLSGLNQLQVNQCLFGAPWRDPDWLLPTGLQVFAAAVGDVLGHGDAGYWARNHTAAPYFGATLDAERRCRLDQAMACPRNGPRRPVSALAAQEWFRPCPVLCEVCVEEDLRACGFAIVRIGSLLPYQTRCPVHGELVHRYPCWAFLAPGKPQSPAIVRRRAAGGLYLARLSTALLACGDAGLLQDLRGRLACSPALVTAGGSLRRSDIVRLLRARWRGCIEDAELAGLIDDENRIARALSALWQPRRTLHPLFGALLLDALEESGVVSSGAEISATVASRRARLAVLQSTVRQDAGTATQLAKAAGVSVTTAVVAALAHGATVSLRPKKLMPGVRQLIKQLLDQGADVAQVGAAAGVSNASVYRVLRSDPAFMAAWAASRLRAEVQRRRETWAGTLEEWPSLPCKPLREKNAAAYAFLYRHDREWLLASTSHRVTPPPVQGSKRAPNRVPEGADQQLACRMIAIANAHAQGDVARLTAAQLMKSSGRDGRVLRRQGTPIAAGVAPRLVESAAQFVRRRLHAAALGAKASGLPLRAWRIARLSGLRPSTIKRASGDMARAIERVRARALAQLGSRA